MERLSSTIFCGLSACHTLAALGKMLIVFFATNKGFVYFNFAGKWAYIVALHRSTPAHTHIPASAVVRAGVFTEDDAVNLQGTDPLLADQHEIANLEPNFERFFGILKDCAGENRKAITVLAAATNSFAAPVKRASLQGVDMRVATARATHTFRPAHFHQELAAREFIWKLFIEGINCFHASKVTHDGFGVNTNIIANLKCSTMANHQSYFSPKATRTMAELSILEKRVVAAEKYGREWADLHAIWLQLDESKKSVLAGLQNDLDDGDTSEAKLERLARATKEYREYVNNLALAKGAELRAKVRYDNARDLFSAAQSDQATEREKLKHLGSIP